MNFRQWGRSLGCALLLLIGAFSTAPDALAGGERDHRVVRQGLAVTLSVAPADAAAGDGRLTAGAAARMTLKVEEAQSGRPKRGHSPGVWIDIADRPDLGPGGKIPCEKKAGLFQSGRFGAHPLIDLNRYFILTLNDDPTISVIDPMAGMAGITRLYALIELPAPGADWIQEADGKRLFVSMPKAGEVAFADTGTLKVVRTAEAGEHPMRLALPPRPGILWVGNDSPDPARSGVTLLDIDSGTKVAEIPTGRGHHEIAFSAAAPHAFVSNREEGTVTILDTQRHHRMAEIRTGPLPISLVYSGRDRALYVADGLSGEITVIDDEGLRVVSRIADAPGLGPMRLTPDGRHLLALNTARQTVLVIDPETRRIAQRIPVEGRPFQIAFTETYAYIRSLETDTISLIRLADLGKGSLPIVAQVAAGAAVGDRSEAISLAGTVAPAPGEAAALVVNRTDETVYYYMEGMAAPMGNFRTYGHRPRAVGAIDRILKEEAPGRFTAPVQFPAGGTYEVILQLQNPPLLHCFRVEVAPDPSERERVRVEYLTGSRNVPVGEALDLKFRFVGEKSGRVRADIGEASVFYYRVPGSGRTELPAEALGGGTFRARLPVPEPGAYYVSVISPSLGTDAGPLNALTFWSEEGR